MNTGNYLGLYLRERIRANASVAQGNESETIRDLPLMVNNPIPCRICMESKRLRLLCHKVTPACEHSCDVCLECLATSIHVQIEGKIRDHISCPSCSKRLPYESILYYRKRNKMCETEWLKTLKHSFPTNLRSRYDHRDVVGGVSEALPMLHPSQGMAQGSDLCRSGPNSKCLPRCCRGCAQSSY